MPPDWCQETDCLFYNTDECENCEQCTYCGESLGYHGENRHDAHYFRAESRGGRTWVPACPSCNLSQQERGLVAWLEYLHDSRPEKFDRIVAHQEAATDMTYVWGERKKIAHTILEMNRRLRSNDRV